MVGSVASLVGGVVGLDIEGEIGVGCSVGPAVGSAVVGSSDSKIGLGV